jgi:2-keto-4-pentenoate hydratase/2-oxohepta-3-ene-1,7-dioic acid hydratase in catechol pathway
MRYVRYSRGGKTSYGVLDGDVLREISGGLFGDLRETGNSTSLGEAKLSYPCEPTKILAVGLNYQSHLGSRKRPSNPEIFFKPTSALQAPEEAILFPPGACNLHYEGELVVVIGKETRGVTVPEAERNIFGFTCGIDVSEREWQKNDLQWWRAKGCDTFAPLGPAIVTGFDWRNSRIETRVNGLAVQSGRFEELMFDPPAIISFVSQYLTLYPGDVIYTGTPGNTGALNPGDLVEVDIAGIGILCNRVAGQLA